NPWRTCIHPEDRAAVARERAAAVALRGPYAIEYRLRRHDGVYGWFHESGAPRLSPSGEFAGPTAACTNVDGRRLAESALLDSEDRFRRFMANAPAVAYIKDLAGRYVWVNEAFMAAFGVEAHEALGRNDVALHGVARGHTLRALDLR